MRLELLHYRKVSGRAHGGYSLRGSILTMKRATVADTANIAMNCARVSNAYPLTRRSGYCGVANADKFAVVFKTAI